MPTAPLLPLPAFFSLGSGSQDKLHPHPQLNPLQNTSTTVAQEEDEDGSEIDIEDEEDDDDDDVDMTDIGEAQGYTLVLAKGERVTLTKAELALPLKEFRKFVQSKTEITQDVEGFRQMRRRYQMLRTSRKRRSFVKLKSGAFMDEMELANKCFDALVKQTFTQAQEYWEKHLPKNAVDGIILAIDRKMRQVRDGLHHMAQAAIKIED
jgi:hypothetical protein